MRTPTITPILKIYQQFHSQKFYGIMLYSQVVSDPIRFIRLGSSNSFKIAQGHCSALKIPPDLAENGVIPASFRPFPCIFTQEPAGKTAECGSSLPGRKFTVTETKFLLLLLEQGNSRKHRGSNRKI
jgi:hypothetical protein